MRSGDSFVEATDLLNLGFLARDWSITTRVGPFDEAADLARPIQAQPVIQAAVGNMDVAYSALGDFEKALSNFQQAEQVARQVGTTSARDRLAMECRVGLLQARGIWKRATKCYQEALQGAVGDHSPQEIAGVHTQLAFLLYQERQFDSAKDAQR